MASFQVETVRMPTAVLEEQMSARPAAISIIIPTYNAEKYIAQTLESVLAQTVTDWTLTVVDDGSRDGTCARVERYAERDSRIRLVRQANAGAVAARNRGLAEVDPAAQYVILLDHDDMWEADALQILRNALEARPDAVAAHGLIRGIDGDGQPMPSYLVDNRAHSRRTVVGDEIADWPLEGVTNFAALCLENWIITPGAVLIRRAALQEVGPLDPAVYPCDDWDLWLRLSRRGDLLSLANPVLRYRLHDDNASNNQQRMAKANLRLRTKAFRSKENTPEQRQVLRVAREKYFRVGRWGYLKREPSVIMESVRRGEYQRAIRRANVLLRIFIRHLFFPY